MIKTQDRKTLLRTLVVDDSPATARAIRSFLEMEVGAEVAGMAQSGAEAVAMARDLQPDLMLVDLFMPGLSGLEVVKRVRQASPATRIIIITVLGEELSGACESVGAQGYVVKNRLHDSLPRAIERLFGQRA